MPKALEFAARDPAALASEKRKVPTRQRNEAYRSREFLTQGEVDKMVKGLKGRYPQRDRLLVLMMYRHGLRLSEATSLKWDSVDFRHARLHVRRLKNGLDSTHPIQGDVLRLLRAVQRLCKGGEYIFLSERGAPLTASSVRYIVRKAGNAAGIKNAHPHQLRHGTGYYLANKGVDTRAIQEYLGHKSIAHTIRYTQLSAERFKNLWD